MPRRLLEAGSFLQLNLYTTDFYDLPNELFWHPEINWHHQQLGVKGLIAAAGLWIRNSEATITTVQSDVCQQLYRHVDLKRAHKTQVETHFKHWYAVLFNAVLDFCSLRGLSVLYSPTGHQIVGNTRKKVVPDLFLRIYDYPPSRYVCRRTSYYNSECWEIPVEVNAPRVARLREARTIPKRGASHRRKICIFHDVEEDVDTTISAAECSDNLNRMLQIEKEFGLDATYDVLGSLLARKKKTIQASNPRHSIAFHSFNHRLEDLKQLDQCRNVDLRVRGYRPPRSRITAELTDYNLTFSNFEWFASSAYSFGFDRCKLENGLVKIPIDLDDHPLFTGQVGYEYWERNLLKHAREKQFLAFGLHDCYAGLWLTRYPQLLHKLAEIGDFVSADELSDGIFLEESESGSERATNSANGRRVEADGTERRTSASEFEAISRYATRVGLKRFILHGRRSTEYVVEQARTGSGYRETGRTISIATGPNGRPESKLPWRSSGT